MIIATACLHSSLKVLIISCFNHQTYAFVENFIIREVVQNTTFLLFTTSKLRRRDLSALVII